MVTSKASVRPLYIYSQAFGKDWVTVGTYVRAQGSEPATFRYAPDYLDRSDWVSIDPVNLSSSQPDRPFVAFRYQGLNDVLRDICPDSWGRRNLIRYGRLSDKATALDTLKVTCNSDRWGALAIGEREQAKLIKIGALSISSIDLVVAELSAMEKGLPAVNKKFRDRLAKTSLGGARPKASVQDKDGICWLVKPQSVFDHPQTAQLECFAQTWGTASGMNFAQTQLLQTQNKHAAVLVKRFDRENSHRKMCLSAASLLQYEFPSGADRTGESTSPTVPSYPRLADVMRAIGCPKEDRQELFKRMIFNVICGNDDDHVRNHAVVYDMSQHRWRLSPAYDVVPTQGDLPSHLAMGVSHLDTRITLENVLSGHAEFGFENQIEAKFAALETFDKVSQSYETIKDLLDRARQKMISEQISEAASKLFGR